MNLKKAMLERIEQKSIKINVGTEEKKEYIFLKNTGGWHVIYPPVNIKSVDKATTNGITNWKEVKWNYTNLIFGGKKNAVWTAIIGAITLFLAIGIKQIIVSYNIIASNPIIQACAKQAGIVLSGI